MQQTIIAPFGWLSGGFCTNLLTFALFRVRKAGYSPSQVSSPGFIGVQITLSQQGGHTLFGLEAIAHANGWTIAVTGACIVFAGLGTLSFTISQLQKLVALLDRPPKSAQEVVVEEPKVIWTPPDCPNDIEIAIRLYQPLIEELPSEFELAELYVLAGKYHLPHPHLSIRCLCSSGKLEPLGEGRFRFLADQADD